MYTEHWVAANPEVKPVDLGCESIENWLLPPISTITIVIITQQKLIIILPSVGGWKAEPT